MKNKPCRIFVIPHNIILGLSLALIVSGITLTLFGGFNIYKTAQVMAVPLEGKVILLDPGHGGADAGASEGNAVEKTINLEVTNFLKEYIEENGGIAYMTRIEDTNTADPNRPKGMTQKMSDLKTRKKNIEDYNADIFISIHMNKFGQSQYRGFQVFYDGNSTESKKLGEHLQQSVLDVLQDGNRRKAKATGNSIFVLKGNTVPSALVECGFLSNPEERKLLTTPQYQRKIAWGIYLGIMRYLTKN